MICPGLRTVGGHRIDGCRRPASIWLQDNLGTGVRYLAESAAAPTLCRRSWPERQRVPVWPGELSAPCLGVAVDRLMTSRAQPVRGEMGELVITAPMPSMPVSIWNDPDGRRYHDTYFAHYPGRVAAR